MTNKIKKFLYTLEHLIPDAHEEIPTFAFYHPLLTQLLLSKTKLQLTAIILTYCVIKCSG